jgi:hypothetical protein
MVERKEVSIHTFLLFFLLQCLCARAVSSTLSSERIVKRSHFLGVPCAPAECGFQPYFNRSPSTSWLVEILGAGHNQFVDNRGAADICPTGTATDATVQDLTNTIAVAWAEKTTRGVNIDQYMRTWAAEQQAQRKITSSTK